MPPESAIGDMPFGDIFDMEKPPRIDLPDGPIITAVAQNEMPRLPDYLRHHRAIGVRHFLIVDNGSTDDTAAFLDAQPDVTRFFSTRHFPTFKPIFRPWLSDNFGSGRWVLAPDIDEQLVYPGWPDVPLGTLLRHWAANDCDGVFAPMVDMYADRPLAEVRAGAGTPLVETYPLFDALGYWVAPPSRSARRRAPTPPYVLYGGARVRVGRGAQRGPREWLRGHALRRLMDFRRPDHPRPGARLAHLVLMSHEGKTAGMKSKVPLVRWRRGYRFPGSNHMVGADLRLAPDWVALLHFRMMTDYAERERAWAARKSQEPRDEDKLAERYEIDMTWAGSRRLDTWHDLLDAGLMRMSPELASALDLPVAG